MKQKILCNECRDETRKLFPTDNPYPGEHVKFVQGLIKHDGLVCDDCEHSFKKLESAWAFSSWADYGGIPYYDWENDYLIIDMIKYESIQNEKGQRIENVPIVQFSINDNQRVAIIGCDFDELGGYEAVRNEIEGIDDFYIGKLEEQGDLVMLNITLNSLKNIGWDFDHYANPELLILTIRDDEK